MAILILLQGLCGFQLLCHLTTSGLSKDIQCHVLPCSFLCHQITTAEIRPQAKWVISLVIADGHLNLSQGFVWV